MTQLYETIEADTLFEAQQIAKEKYGNSYAETKHETINQNMFLGFGKKERIRLTIKRNPASQPVQGSTFSYITPEPELTISDLAKETPASYSAPINPIINKKAPAKATSFQVKDRETGSIRGILENNDEPLHNNENSCNCTADVLNLINKLNKIKDGREREAEVCKDVKINSITNKKMDEMMHQMDALLTCLKQTNLSTNDYLNSHSCLPRGLAYLEKELLKEETPQEIIDILFNDLRVSCEDFVLENTEATFKALHDILKNKINISSQFTIKKQNSPQVIVLMGPTGVGKTTTLAKLAARYCLNANKPIKSSILNIDFYRLGASAQLSTYASIFDIPLEDITSIASLDYYLDMHKNDDLIIVDTAGRSQYATEDLKELKNYLDKIPNATKYLTISSTSKYSDMKDIISSFSKVGFDNIILTKTDETKTIGPAVGMLLKTNSPIAYITHGQQVPEDYRIADFKFFEEKLFSTNGQ